MGVGIGITPKVPDGDVLLGSLVLVSEQTYVLHKSTYPWPFPGPFFCFDIKAPITDPRITPIKVRTTSVKIIDQSGMIPQTLRFIVDCHGFSDFGFSE